MNTNNSSQNLQMNHTNSSKLLEMNDTISSSTSAVHIGLALLITAHSLNLILGLPVNSYVLWLILRGAGGTVASELFYLNLIASVILSSLASAVHAWLLTHDSLFHIVSYFVFVALFALALPLFQCCICLERYVAVVHPLAFRRYGGQLRYKACCCCAVWLAVLALGSLVFWSQTVSCWVFLGFCMACVSVVCFCCLSVLRALKQAGPGGGQRDRRQPKPGEGQRDSGRQPGPVEGQGDSGRQPGAGGEGQGDSGRQPGTGGEGQGDSGRQPKPGEGQRDSGRQPGLGGEGKRDSGEAKDLKRRAFRIIVVSLVVMTVTIVSYVPNVLSQLLNTSTVAPTYITYAIALLVAFVHPLLYMHKAGKLPRCVQVPSDSETHVVSGTRV